ncbi:jg19231, partial [Pararge aegeria aegeria]
SQAMKIVRTVGQAFEVCHKMQGNTQDNPVPSTSSAPDDVVTIEHVRECPAARGLYFRNPYMGNEVQQRQLPSQTYNLF